MKQIIDNYYKYYENDRGQKHGLFMYYYESGNPMFKTNYVNGKRYGLETWYKKNGKIKKKHTYYL